MKFLWVFIVLIIILFSPTKTNAQSSYVLPYPSFLPGSVFYKPHLLFEEVSRYWSFGNFGQFKYSLREADKYLVESKTLFEYKQYLLAIESLKKSNSYFDAVLPNLYKAQKENRNISQNRNILHEASLKHVEVLLKIEKEIPETFVWQPEKKKPTTLYLKKEIREAIDIRRKNL